MKKIRNSVGLALNKPIIIMAILIVLAACTIPKLFNSSDSESKSMSEKSVVGGVRAGIQTFYAQHQIFPATLDSANNGNCASANICFSTVLSQDLVTANWKKAGFNYTGPNGGTFTYAPATGSFN